MSTIRRAKSPGYDVTGSFVAYAPPLIGESTLTVPVEQGLPRFARLCRAQLSCVFSWINNPDSLLSNEGLSAAITAEGDPESKYELSAILEWSKRVNWAVGEIVKGIPSFPYVRKSLQRIQGQADLAVVSAPLFEVLLREWAEHDIESDTALISGQEMGGKRKHIAALGDRLHS